MAFPVTEARVLAAEAALGWRLPEMLRTRLMVENGGEVQVGDDPDNIWWLHPVWDDSDRKRMGRTANHVIRETEIARKWGRFPEDAAAIAGNGTGDFLIVRRGDDRIYWFSHETGDTVSVDVTWKR